MLTLISNTSADPISGTFSNLPDGSIVTINGNISKPTTKAATGTT